MKHFYIVTSFIIFLPFVIGLIRFNHLDVKLKVIFYLVAIGCIFNLLMLYFGLFQRENVWLGHIYTIFEFFFVIFFFYLLFERILFRRIILILILVFVIVTTLNKVYFESLHKIDNYTLTISAILLLIASSMYLVDYLSRNLIINPKDYKFLVTVGFMIYFAGNLFIFALSNEIHNIWVAHNVIHTILVLLFSLVFIWQK